MRSDGQDDEVGFESVRSSCTLAVTFLAPSIRLDCSGPTELTHPSGACRDKLGFVNWLGNVVVAARVQTFASVLSHCVSSEGNDGKV